MNCLFRIKSVDMRYQVWKWGVIFTDNVSISKSSFWIGTRKC
jgi:hypothetical protein